MIEYFKWYRFDFDERLFDFTRIVFEFHATCHITQVLNSIQFNSDSIWQYDSSSFIENRIEYYNKIMNLDSIHFLVNDYPSHIYWNSQSDSRNVGENVDINQIGIEISID